eukprot:COSAG02_NODE_31107_length_539_cov_0.829545_2_plen_70_part_01
MGGGPAPPTTCNASDIREGCLDQIEELVGNSQIGDAKLTLEIGVRRVRSLGPGVPRLKTLSSRCRANLEF